MSYGKGNSLRGQKCARRDRGRGKGGGTGGKRRGRDREREASDARGGTTRSDAQRGERHATDNEEAPEKKET